VENEVSKLKAGDQRKRPFTFKKEYSVLSKKITGGDPGREGREERRERGKTSTKGGISTCF